MERCEFVSFLGFVNNNDCAAEILTMTARGGGEGEEIFGGGDNHATREDDETTTKATPQSLGKWQGMDEMMNVTMQYSSVM